MGSNRLTDPPNLVRPPLGAVRPIIEAALSEDIGAGDITSEATTPAAAQAEGHFLAKAKGVVAGLWVAAMVFRQLDPAIELKALVPEAGQVAPGDRLAQVHGPARSILSGERVALNFLQRLSGIATMSRLAMDAVAGTATTILDTRKTTPGLRVLEKYAVRAGGAANHRSGLYDMVLIKDNHVRVAGGIAAAVSAARRGASPMHKIEVEVGTLEQVREALAAGADIIMLDNMDKAAMAGAVALIGERALIEASGKITVATCREVAELGVNFISMGALTHSYESLDVSLELELWPGGRAASRQ